jgi:hypothetical protein
MIVKERVTLKAARKWLQQIVRRQDPKLSPKDQMRNSCTSYMHFKGRGQDAKLSAKGPDAELLHAL